MPDPHAKSETCSLCDREVPARLITQHHLLPRQKGGKPEHRTPMCRTCHKQVHALFSNSELAKEFATIAALKAAPRLALFLKWIRNQRPDRTFRTAMSGDHPRMRSRRRRR